MSSPSKRSNLSVSAQHPRPDLAATPDDPAVCFASTWRRFSGQWLIPSDPLAVVHVTVADLRAAALEIFSAGGVHHAATSERFAELMGEDRDRRLERMGS